MRTISLSLVALTVVACGTDLNSSNEVLNEVEEQDVIEVPEEKDPVEENEPGDGAVTQGDCPAFPPAAISVTVTAPDASIVCDATVVISDGEFSRTAQRGGLDGACVYFSVFERAGTYQVQASHDAYAPASIPGVVVSLDDCGHAVTNAVDLAFAGPSTPIDDPLDPDPNEEDPITEPEPDAPVLEPTPAFTCPDGEPAFDGDVALDGAADLAQLDGIVCVAGHVVVGPALATLDLQDVVRIMGDLVIEGASALDDVSLASLTTVDGELVVSGTSLTTLVGFAALRTVGGALAVVDNADLTNADMQVTSVGALVIEGNDALPRARLRTLVDVGSIAIGENPELDDMDLRAVVSVPGDVVVTGGVFAELDLSALATVDGALTFADFADIEDFQGFGELSSVGGDLTLAEMPNVDVEDAEDFASSLDVAGSVTVCGMNGGDDC